MAIAALVLGIVANVISIIPFLGTLGGIGALVGCVLGIISACITPIHRAMAIVGASLCAVGFISSFFLRALLLSLIFTI